MGSTVLNFQNALSNMADLDLDEIYVFAKQLGRDAGCMLQDATQRRISGDLASVNTEKASSVDIVTQVRVKNPTALLAGALVHEPADDELAEANGSDERAGRIRFGSSFLDRGWLKYEKIV